MSDLLQVVRDFLQPPRQSSSYIALDLSPDASPSFGPEKDLPPPPLSLPRLFSLLLSLSFALSVIFTCLTLLFLADPKNPIPPTTRVILRTVDDNGAGIGSVLQQLQRSAVFAEAMGGELVAVESKETGHGYDTVGVMNGKRKTRMGVEWGRVCRLSRYMNQQAYQKFTNTVCEKEKLGLGVETLSIAELGATSSMHGCSVILNDQPWEYDPQMCECTWRHTTRLFGNPVPRLVSRKTTVGLHIRWGDMAAGGFGGDTREEYRSIPISRANEVIHGLEECLGHLSLRIYMEAHNSTMLEEIDHPFLLVDSGRDLDDLLDLTSNEVLIVAGSGYTMMANQMARGGLTVVPNFDPNARWWETTGTNKVLKWKDFVEKGGNDCGEVRRLFDEGKERGRMEMSREKERAEVKRGAGKGAWRV
ncbi:hypothetical protein P7C70_g3991, partial [Phenoliferia sp. Uapishka_3]